MKKQSLIETIAAVAITTSLSLTGFSADEKKDAKGPGAGGKGGDAPKAVVIFKAIDKNDDGKITPKELGDSKRFKDADKKDVGAAFKDRDLDGDGAISMREFGKSFTDAAKEKGKGGKGKGKGAKGKGKGKGKGGKG